MSHLPFPFISKGVLIFRNPDKDFQEVNTEIAESQMEIFQSWCYRMNQSNDYLPALTLYFTNPNQQHMVMFDYDFAVTVVEIETSGGINNIYEVPRQSNAGSFIKTFYGLKMVILFKSADGLHSNFNIQKNFTKAELKEISV